MDPITHCLVGGMAAKTAGVSRRRFWIMMFLGEAADLDVIFNSLGSWAFWLQHRGITHSFLGLALQALFYSWAFRKWDKGDFRERTWHYSLPLALHLMCDYLTSFGVPLLSPFSFQEFSADLVVGLTLIPAGFMAVGLFQMYRRNHGGWRAAGPLWAVWILYVSLAMSGKAYAGRLVQASSGSPATTIPSVLNPFAWSAIHLDDSTHTYRHYTVDLLTGEKRTALVFKMPNGDFPVKASAASPKVQEFLKNHRWPVVRFSVHPEGGWDVEWGNLLFSSRGMVRAKVRVHVASDGSIVSADKVFGFWNPESIEEDVLPAVSNLD